MILAACDGPVRAPDGAIACPTAPHVVELLRTFVVPVVFISDEAPAAMVQLQQQLGMRPPFIAAGGTQLYVPRGYFPDVLDTEPDEEPDRGVLRLQARGGDVGDAVRLMAGYRLSVSAERSNAGCLVLRRRGETH